MSKGNAKSLITAAGILLVMALFFLAAPFLSITLITIGVFYFLLSSRRAARRVPVDIRRDE